MQPFLSLSGGRCLGAWLASNLSRWWVDSNDLVLESFQVASSPAGCRVAGLAQSPSSFNNAGSQLLQFLGQFI